MNNLVNILSKSVENCYNEISITDKGKQLLINKDYNCIVDEIFLKLEKHFKTVLKNFPENEFNNFKNKSRNEIIKIIKNINEGK